jgi:hypothetical protein
MDRGDDETKHAQALADITARIAADNLAMRACFLAEVPCYSHEQVSTRFGSDVAGSNRVICVEVDGRRHYPCFQFDGAGVRLNVEAALARLPPNMSRWQIAFWFVASNPWLDGKAPCDVLADREQLIYAAEQESGVVG